MKMDLPKNIQIDQITSLVEILSSKLTGSTFSEIKAINKLLTEKIINAAIFVGLVREQDAKYLITESGKKYYQAQDLRAKNEAIRKLLKQIDIYNVTVEYLHHNKLSKPTKLDIGSYWNGNFSPKIKGLDEEDLTSAIIFFLKFLELASLGKFIFAGRGRETRIDLDMVEVAKYVTTDYAQAEVKPSTKQEKKLASSEENKVVVSEEDVSGSLSILKKLNPELVWNDLDSDGAKKLIIDKLNTLSNQNIVLGARVEEYQKLDGINVVLKEKVHNLKIDNLFRASVNSIGGVILGIAISSNQTIYQFVGGLIGIILIGVSIFLKQTEPKKEE
jgi:hypothetical protein